MSSYIKNYKDPSGELIEVWFIDNRGGAARHPGGEREYSKDYYYAIVGDNEMGMMALKDYCKKHGLIELKEQND
jgi:hypothetical protein